MLHYTRILKQELVQALGCTEPIAIALCAAKAREVLGSEPSWIKVACSGNVIKNAMCVTVPKSGGHSGIKVAAALGCYGGEASLGLQVLEAVKEDQAQEALAYVLADRVSISHARDVDKLYIKVMMGNDMQEAVAVISGQHDHFSFISRNGKVLLDQAIKENQSEQESIEYMSLEGILSYIHTFDVSSSQGLEKLLSDQVACNLAIAEEGLRGEYGAGVGKTLLAAYPDDVRVRLRAYAAAGSDARMAGSALPVVINSGSGNQGMTCSLPLIVYAGEKALPKEKLFQALALSNLLALYIKALIGRLSAFCGVVSAAAAAGAGLGYLQGMGDEQIAQVITITLLTSGGILCDGAKASCASKIAVALDNALLALEMVRQGRSLPDAQGLAGKDADDTIRRVAQVAKEGMEKTDQMILEQMLQSY